MTKAGVTWVEFFLHEKIKRDGLTKEQANKFWQQREWHPGVQMAWMAELDADGAGKTMYPDGTVDLYSLTIRP